MLNRKAQSPTQCPPRQPICDPNADPDWQPFPKRGTPLHPNVDLDAIALPSHLAGASGTVYSYVVTSVWSQPMSPSAPRHATVLRQYGSGPNFQGGVLTLCTCKHQMRAGMTAAEWVRGYWIAGFTSRQRYAGRGRHYLVYLSRIRVACSSQYELWQQLDPQTRRAKSSRVSPYGDLYEPRHGWDGTRPWSSCHYLHPRTDHVHADCWKSDIECEYYRRHPALLVGDPSATYLWERPRFYLDGEHERGSQTWAGVGDLLDSLRQVG